MMTAQRNPRSWWLKQKNLQDFGRSFVSEVYYVLFWGKKRVRNYLNTNEGRRLAEAFQIVWDFLLSEHQEILSDLLLYQRNQNMAGEALAFAFMGKDFAWVEIGGIDEVEPWVSDTPVMDQRTFYNDFEGAQEKFMTSERFEEVTELPDDEQVKELRKFFNSVARPVSEFPPRVLVITAHDVEFNGATIMLDPATGEGVGQIRYTLRQPSPFQRRERWASDYPWKRILQQVRWQDVPLPFHAWDMGMSREPRS